MAGRRGVNRVREVGIGSGRVGIGSGRVVPGLGLVVPGLGLVYRARARASVPG